MHPAKVNRDYLKSLTDLPNIGKASERDLHVLGIRKPKDLVGMCPYEMHRRLSDKTGVRQDPCVIDVFISITRFMAGEEPKVWWEYTADRKKYLRRVERN